MGFRSINILANCQSSYASELQTLSNGDVKTYDQTQKQRIKRAIHIKKWGRGVQNRM
jgi:hypothetical protein